MSNELVKKFKAYYSDLITSDLCQLSHIYDNDAEFRDPVHCISGVVALEEYLLKLCSNVTECRFEFLDELVDENSAYIKWIMHYRHPKMGNKLISVRGASHIRFKGKIEFHEDIYDLGEMLYEHIPVIGWIVRAIKRGLSK